MGQGSLSVSASAPAADPYSCDGDGDGGRGESRPLIWFHTRSCCPPPPLPPPLVSIVGTPPAPICRTQDRAGSKISPGHSTEGTGSHVSRPASVLWISLSLFFPTQVAVCVPPAGSAHPFTCKGEAGGICCEARYWLSPEGEF